VTLVLTTYALVGGAVVLLLCTLGRQARVLTPVLFFISIEAMAVWPALVPVDGSPLANLGAFPAVLAAISLFAMVTTYVLFGGASVDASTWRRSPKVPGPAESRCYGRGLILLVLGLCVLGLLTFGGIPPMLAGGFSSLLDPVGHADQAALIRETRLTLTKGHTLLGEQYAGQGIVNAANESGWRIAVIVAVLYWSWERSKRSLFLLLTVCVLSFVFLGSAGSRSPVILCGIGFVAALAIRYRLRMRHLVLMGAAGLAAMLLIMPLSKGASGGVSAGDRTAEVIERITEGNGQNNAQIVRLISAEGLELQNGGLLVDRLLAMLPGASPGDPFALQVTRLAYGANAETTGYSTPTQFGLLYADGGALWVLVGYVLSGLLLALAWRRIARVTSPLGAAIAVEGAISLGYLSVSGIHGVLSAALMAALALSVVVSPWLWRSWQTARTPAPPSRVKVP
jgi:hypothetical protein